MPESGRPIRVVVVDDSAFMRRAISTMIDAADDMEVVAKAKNGLEALEVIAREKPDAITLDIEMPEMDGLTALRHIKRNSDAAVLMVSSLTVAGSAAALSALRMGADDFIAKDSSQISLNVVHIEDELQAKLRAIAHRPARKLVAHHDEDHHEAAHSIKVNVKDIDLVVIGSSTGGPPVLETLVEAIPAELAVPVVIAQHMPKLFTQAMSERLDGVCHAPVIHGEHGMPIKRGCVYVSPGELHTRVRKAGVGKYQLKVGPEPADAIYRPSVNELFDSAADCCGKRCLATVLTGMGDDGLVGSRKLHEVGAPIIAQDRESCVVYGMPKAVTEAGLINASLTPDQIAKVLSTLAGDRVLNADA